MSKTWIQPSVTSQKQLFIHNSLTKQKSLFVPAKGNFVSWYVCGPTVYDKSHLGHARAYITFDIIRRILADYFKYDVFLVMNITDIDDKIIINARQNHLFEKFCEQYTEISPALVEKGRQAWKYFVESKFADHGLASSDNWLDFTKKDKPDPLAHPKFMMYFKTASEMHTVLDSPKSTSLSEFFSASKDVFRAWLDNELSSTINDPQIFRDFAAYWEKDFFQDMEALNVLKPDVLTRVSEYVPEIVDYVKVIVDNGFGYESEGSVYFDTQAFEKAGHEYAKLVPTAKNNSKLILEGEGALTTTFEKRSPSDFALWKKSKSGEPFWDSPWGSGRPGWHIECSVMASAILGKNMDIHSGGIDLAFPHHDNELAQAEAHYNHHQWVNYFLHAGHLHIENLKMSKSLKNFLSIKETLEKTSASTIRIMLLMHAWDAILDYSGDSIGEARQLQSSIQNFLNLVKALSEEEKLEKESGEHNYSTQEAVLVEQLFTMLEDVRGALCDNFDTPKVMTEIKNIISLANTYYADKQKSKSKPNVSVMTKIGTEITKLMRIFGVFESEAPIGGFGSTKQGSDSLPVLKTMSSFRDSIRELAQANIKDSKVFGEMLKLCDKLRDEDLVEHGVVLEDRDGMGALVKLMDKDLLIRERKEKELKAELKKQEKEKRLEEERLKKQARLEKGKTKPEDLFKTSEFSQWDESGLPTLLADGTPVPKARKKKCDKELAAQKKLHEEYLKSLQ